MTVILLSRYKYYTTSSDSKSVFYRLLSQLVGEVHSTDHHYLQLLAIIQRQMMEKLNMELLGRNYYDPQAASIVREFCLEVWPGYVTSIRQHEEKMLLCCEVSCKVLR